MDDLWDDIKIELSTPLADYYLENDILFCRTTNRKIDDILLASNYDQIKTYLGNRKVPILIDARRSVPSEKKHRDEFKVQLEEICQKMAVYSSSPVTNTMINIYLSLLKPTVTVKLFNNAEKALAWLAN